MKSKMPGPSASASLELLIVREKIVLTSTHGPIPALTGDRRIVARNAGLKRDRHEYVRWL
jgi:hypothetical protein